MYLLYAGGVEWQASVHIIGFQLGFGSVGDGAMFVRRVLQCGGVWVPKSESDFSDVAVHSAPTGVLFVIPFTVDTCKLFPFPICSNVVVRLEGC